MPTVPLHVQDRRYLMWKQTRLKTGKCRGMCRFRNTHDHDQSVVSEFSHPPTRAITCMTTCTVEWLHENWMSDQLHRLGTAHTRMRLFADRSSTAFRCSEPITGSTRPINEAATTRLQHTFTVSPIVRLPFFLDDWLRLLYFNSPPLLPPDISSVTALRLAPSWSSRMSNALAQNELLFSNRAYFAAELLNAFALGEYHRPLQHRQRSHPCRYQASMS
jgi:hypothetical protein